MLKEHNAENYTLWAHGMMSRQVGLFGSCPANNPKVFGFTPEDIRNGNVETIVAKA
jgi:hypothetical protein